MVTIRDVAERAGVSVATVSHVINGTRKVAPETAERVRRAMEELDYHPNAVARSLRTRKTQVIGVVVSDITNPFFATLVRGAEGSAAVALLPGGAILSKKLHPDLPVIAKLNSSLKAPEGEQHCVLTGSVEDMAKAGVEFVGMTYYYGNAYEHEMREQLRLLDREAAKYDMGLIVWNYPRGMHVPKAFESALHTQRSGSDMIMSIASNALLLLKEKITVPYDLQAWLSQKDGQDDPNFSRTNFKKPGAKGVKEEAVKELLSLSRGELIERLVRPQLRLGIASMMSGGEIQKEESFKRDLADGIGPTRHLGLIAGRSTWGAAEYDWDTDTFNNEGVLAHAKLMHESLPTVVC